MRLNLFCDSSGVELVIDFLNKSELELTMEKLRKILETQNEESFPMATTIKIINSKGALQ